MAPILNNGRSIDARNIGANAEMIADSEQSSTEHDSEGSCYSDFDTDSLSEEDEAYCDDGDMSVMSEVRKSLAHMLSQELDRAVPIVAVEDEEEEKGDWGDLDVDVQVVPYRARDQMRETRRKKEVWGTKKAMRAIN